MYELAKPSFPDQIIREEGLVKERGLAKFIGFPKKKSALFRRSFYGSRAM